MFVNESFQKSMWTNGFVEQGLREGTITTHLVQRKRGGILSAFKQWRWQHIKSEGPCFEIPQMEFDVRKFWFLVDPTHFVVIKSDNLFFQIPQNGSERTVILKPVLMRTAAFLTNKIPFPKYTRFITAYFPKFLPYFFFHRTIQYPPQWQTIGGPRPPCAHHYIQVKGTCWFPFYMHYMWKKKPMTDFGDGNLL